MDIFVDLLGASGASYRFRAWPEAGQSPMAGNFVVVERDGARIKLRLAGVTNDLSRARQQADAAGFNGAPVFVRLNVSRTTRYEEHEDIVAQYQPDKTVDAGG